MKGLPTGKRVDTLPHRIRWARQHNIEGNLAGTFSVDVKQPYRLLFAPIEETGPADRSNEQARWASITAIEILTIEDTHG